ncbi:hypothetical protein [Streptomyces acidiscabies]|uniref:hypothetical protein n=1 Tax=Streptomyces acidiscabies TaxID=42234 RepID=UPI0015BE42C0|nr:hypothetical protein [Streptomyces acidiscabies]
MANDFRYPNDITGVMQESQRFYCQELGVTFRLDYLVVEAVQGNHPWTWYENTLNGGDAYWWVVFNMQQGLMARFGLGAPDPRWLCVGAEKAGVSGGGGAAAGWFSAATSDSRLCCTGPCTPPASHRASRYTAFQVQTADSASRHSAVLLGLGSVSM